MSEEVKKNINDCVELKILRRVGGNIGIDKNFRKFFDEKLEKVLKTMPEINGNIFNQVDRKAFVRVLAVMIIGYTKITDTQQIMNLTNTTNRIFKMLNEYKKI